MYALKGISQISTFVLFEFKHLSNLKKSKKGTIKISLFIFIKEDGIMINEYFKTLLKKVREYDKKATNPFLKNEYEHNSKNNIYTQTYIWVENNKGLS